MIACTSGMGMLHGHVLLAPLHFSVQVQTSLADCFVRVAYSVDALCSVSLHLSMTYQA